MKILRPMINFLQCSVNPASFLCHCDWLVAELIFHDVKDWLDKTVKIEPGESM